MPDDKVGSDAGDFKLDDIFTGEYSEETVFGLRLKE